MFRFFINLIPFLVLGLWRSFWDNPETETVSHSFPKLCVALQRKFGTDAAYRAGWAMRRRVPNRETAGPFEDLAHRN
jgi:hypothetical protein